MITKEKINRLKSIKNNEVADLFLLEQSKVIVEVLETQSTCIVEVLTIKNSPLIPLLIQKKVPYEVVEHFIIEKLSTLKTPRDAVAVVQKKTEQLLPFKHQVILVLDAIQDPGNLGTIIRTAAWFGITQIVCSQDCVDVYNPKTIQACMGAWLNVNVIYTDLLAFFKQHQHIPIYASSLSGHPLQHISTTKHKNIFFVLGNESKGVNQNILALSNDQVCIEKKGSGDSLNVAVACGVLLYSLTVTKSF